jgi:hypothetical protein
MYVLQLFRSLCPRVQAHPPQRQGLLNRQFIICHLNRNPKIAISPNDIHTVRWKMSANLSPPLLFGIGVEEGVGTCEDVDEDAEGDEEGEGDDNELSDDVGCTGVVAGLEVTDSDDGDETAGVEDVVINVVGKAENVRLPVFSTQEGKTLVSSEVVIATGANVPQLPKSPMRKGCIPERIDCAPTSGSSNVHTAMSNARDNMTSANRLGYVCRELEAISSGCGIGRKYLTQVRLHKDCEAILDHLRTMYLPAL